ncbi:MAG: hypothetical protein AAF939_05860 [Planctomycetota bacterium]
MSILFLVLSVMVGASHRNWKKAATEQAAKAKQFENQRDEAKKSTTSQLKVLQAERVSRALQLAQLESQLKAALENFINKEEQLRKEIEISQERLAKLEQAEARLTQLDRENAELKESNKTYVNDIANQLQVTRELTNQNFEYKNEINLLTEKKSDLVSTLAKQQRVLNAKGLTEDSLTDHIVPKVEGVVVRVGANGLFAVSLGSDDGIRVGHSLDIYRGDRYVGRAKVVNVNSDICAMRSVKEYMRDVVQEGDYVTSKF